MLEQNVKTDVSERRSRVSKGFVAGAVAAVFMVAGSLPAGAATRTWTGAAGDGRWSTAGNWEEGVAAGAGDTVYLTGANDGVISNDVENLSIFSAILTNTAKTVTLVGGKITFTATSARAWSNNCPVVCHVPIDFSTRSSTEISIASSKDAWFWAISP